MERLILSEARRQRQAHFATILGAVVTAGSMLFGLLTYQRSAADQRQTAALGVVQEYLKLAIAHPELASPSPGQAVAARYTWFATHALFTAETLWGLVGDDSRWLRTIGSIMRQHRAYLMQGVMNCGDFRADFVDYVKSQIPELRCAQ
jgi:hypothetical protein